MNARIILSVVFAAVAAGVPLVSAQNIGWKDSFSLNGKCYCDTTFDHNIGPIQVTNTCTGEMITVREACDLAGNPGNESGERAFYNDVQCGNGPANDAGDEDFCPGRVDLGNGNDSGCRDRGPVWDFGCDNNPQQPPEDPEPAPAPEPEPEEVPEPPSDPPAPEAVEETAAAPEDDAYEYPAEEPTEEPEEYGQVDAPAAAAMFFEEEEEALPPVSGNGVVMGLSVTNRGDGSSSPLGDTIKVSDFPDGFSIRAEVDEGNSDFVMTVVFTASDGYERTEYSWTYDMFGPRGYWENPPVGNTVMLTVVASLDDGTEEELVTNITFED